MNEENATYGKKVFFSLLIASFFLVFLNYSFKENADKVVLDQFEAIQQKKYAESYYAFTSKEFQQVTSLDQYKTFLNNLPFIQDREAKIEVLKEIKEVNLTLVEVEITDKNGVKTLIDFQVGKEDDEFKIESIKALSVEEPIEEAVSEENPSTLEPKKVTPDDDFDFTLVQTPIKNLLQLILKGELVRAYKETTSKEFRAATPQERFDQFIGGNPVFLDNLSIRFIKLSFDGNVALYETELTATSGARAPILFYLVLENGFWKIIQIQTAEEPQ